MISSLGWNLPPIIRFRRDLSQSFSAAGSGLPPSLAARMRPSPVLFPLPAEASPHIMKSTVTL